MKITRHKITASKKRSIEASEYTEDMFVHPGVSFSTWLEEDHGLYEEDLTEDEIDAYYEEYKGAKELYRKFKKGLLSSKKANRKPIKASTMYEDVDGIFDDVGSKMSREQLEDLYHDLHDDDPVVQAYDTFEAWLKDSVGHGYLREVSEDTYTDKSEVYECMDDSIGEKGEWIDKEDLRIIYRDLHKYDPVVQDYSTFEAWLKDTVDNGYLRLVREDEKLEGVESSEAIDFRRDRRLAPTSLRYKGYLIVLDRGGDGYNVYDKHRELEDSGYSSLESAKKFVDEICCASKVTSSIDSLRKKLKVKKDYVYDNLSSLDEDEIKIFEELGFVDNETDRVIIPRGTVLKYVRNVGRGVEYEIANLPGRYVIYFNNIDGIFEEDVDEYFEVVASTRVPKYWNSMFRVNVIDAYKKGQLTKQNIEEWETKYNGGVKPHPSLGTKEILDYYLAHPEVVESSDEVGQDDEYDLDQVGQEFTSRDTSINKGKLPAIYKLVSFEPGQMVLDYGGGKFDNGSEYLAGIGAIGCIYDPYNRTSEHNRGVIRQIRDNGGADVALCSNVLNVIKEPEARLNVLKNIRKLLKPSGKVYITVYEGSGSGEGKQSQDDAYQLNRKTKDYLEEIRSVFPDAQRKGKLIYATPTGDVTASQDITCNVEGLEEVKDMFEDGYQGSGWFEDEIPLEQGDGNRLKQYLEDLGYRVKRNLKEKIWMLPGECFWSDTIFYPYRPDPQIQMVASSQKVSGPINEWPAPYQVQEVCKELADALYNEASEIMQSPEFGFDLRDIADYLFIDVTPIPGEYESDGIIGYVAEVRAELTYEGMDELARALNPIVQEQDPEAYFDHVTSGIIEAYMYFPRYKKQLRTTVLTSEVGSLKERIFDYLDRTGGCDAYEEMIEDISDRFGASPDKVEEYLDEYSRSCKFSEWHDTADQEVEASEDEEMSDSDLLDYIVDHYEEITGESISNIFNTDFEEGQPMFDQDSIDRTSESIIEFLSSHGRSDKEIDDLLYELDDKLTLYRLRHPELYLDPIDRSKKLLCKDEVSSSRKLEKDEIKDRILNEMYDAAERYFLGELGHNKEDLPDDIELAVATTLSGYDIRLFVDDDEAVRRLTAVGKKYYPSFKFWEYPEEEWSFRGFIPFLQDDVEASEKTSLDSEIYEFLDECGGYTDYNQKIEDVMEEFGLDQDSAEGYVWNWASGLHKIQGAQETINIPAYGVEWVSGYAGNGVNRHEYKYFRTKEEADEFIDKLKSQNVGMIKIFIQPNFYHTLEDVESSVDDYRYRTRHKNYCPHCTNMTLTEVEDGLYVCDECGAEFEGVPAFEGGLHLREIEASTNIQASSKTVYLKKSKLEDEGLTEDDIDDFTLSISDEGEYLAITGDPTNIWNTLQRYDLQWSTVDRIRRSSKSKNIQASSPYSYYDEYEQIIDRIKNARSMEELRDADEIIHRSRYADDARRGRDDANNFMSLQLSLIKRMNELNSSSSTINSSARYEFLDDSMGEKGSKISYSELKDIYYARRKDAATHASDYNDFYGWLADEVDNGHLRKIEAGRLVDAPQEVVDELINILTDYGFVLDSRFPENPSRTFIFDDVHIQVVNPDSYIDKDEDIQSQLRQYVTRELVDKIHELEDRTNCPITWNFGVDDDLHVTGGLDIMKQYVDDDDKDTIESSVDWLEDEDLTDTYPEDVVQLIKTAVLNKDTSRGYKAFYELEKRILDEGLDSSILYDVAAEFTWDDRLNDEVNKLAQAEGREDLVIEASTKKKYQVEIGGWETVEVEAESEEKALKLVKRKYLDEDDLEELEADPSYIWIRPSEEDDVIESASYGGAYDVEDDMFFTKEELVEFANMVCDSFNEWASPDVYDVDAVYFIGERPNVLEMCISDGDYDLYATQRIDMRKIRRPKDLDKYVPIFLKQLKDAYQEYHSPYEDRSDDGFQDAVWEEYIDSSQNINASEEEQESIDVKQTYDIEFDEEVEVEGTSVDFVGDTHIIAIKDDEYELEEIDDSTGVEEKILELIEPNVPDEPGTYRVSGVAKLTYEITDLYEDTDDRYANHYMTESAKVSYDSRGSWVENFQYEKI